MLPKKREILKGREGSRLWDFEGLERVTHFGISEGKGGLRHGSRPWLGMDIFWNCPIYKAAVIDTHPAHCYKVYAGSARKL